jgi:hypothetical protein
MLSRIQKQIHPTDKLSRPFQLIKYKKEPSLLQIIINLKKKTLGCEATRRNMLATTFTGFPLPVYSTVYNIRDEKVT